MKKFFIGILVLLFVLIAVVLFNTFTFTSTQTSVNTIAAPPVTDSSLHHFTKALTYKTISYGNPALFDSSAFIGFRNFLEKTYPLVHQNMQREIIAGYSLLYTWKGKDENKKPIVIMAHQDVVPVEEATRSMWTFDPFSGTVKDGFVWGRGTTDDKINLIAQFETAEKLLAENFIPARTILFAFGHDEEIGGKGAIAIAKLLKEREITAEMILDEGGIITKEKMPGLTKPVALVGTAEKGYLSLELTVEKPGGHSSMPEQETAIDILTKAIVKVRSQPFEPKFTEPMHGLMQSVGPEMPFVQKMAFANSWLFKNAIIGTYEKSGPGNAMIRTTLVPTIVQAGIKDNVVPTVATATINLRLLPGDKADEVIEKLKSIIADERVVFKKMATLAEASAVTPVKSFGYQQVEAAIKKSYAQTISSPFLVIGATDSRHFKDISTNIIKFSPMIDPIGFHGIDERVSLESYQTALWFYEQLLRDLP
ncbi:MAG: M20 family peptidase [Cyclobacteriaceae bacterium]|jgi:carboxypeptidase PM20D1|nr:M20 family peptidase [Cyclobacteriaceae bacterium]